jgi:DNA-binding XRE family transcriptional regulator
MYHNKIASLRKSWALSQQELAGLLDMSRSNVSRLEVSARHHTLETALILEALFGARVSAIFRHDYLAAYEALLPRLAELSKALEGRTDDAANRQRELLATFARRESASV